MKFRSISNLSVAATMAIAGFVAVGSSQTAAAGCTSESYAWKGFGVLHTSQTSVTTNVVIPAAQNGDTLTVTSVSYRAFDGKSANSTPTRSTEDEPHEQMALQIGTTDVNELTPDLPDTLAEGAPTENYSGLISGQIPSWSGTATAGGEIVLRHSSLYGFVSSSSNAVIAFSTDVTVERCSPVEPTTSSDFDPATSPASPPVPPVPPATCRIETHPWNGFAMLHSSRTSFDTGASVRPPAAGESLAVVDVTYSLFNGKSPGSVPTRATENEPYEQMGISIGSTHVAELTPDLPDAVEQGAAGENYSGLISGDFGQWRGTPIVGGAITLRHSALYGMASASSNKLIVWALTVTVERCGDLGEPNPPDETTTTVADLGEPNPPDETTTTIADLGEPNPPDEPTTTVADLGEPNPPDEPTTTLVGP